MRVDFYSKVADYADLATVITDNQLLVSPMTEAELRQAIEEPARLVGLTIEAGLVERLIHDTQQQPGALPLLQHALFELFERHEAGQLTLAAYEAIGGVQQAIAHRAEQELPAV